MDPISKSAGLQIDIMAVIYVPAAYIVAKLPGSIFRICCMLVG